jgi:hypothetical protein
MMGPGILNTQSLFAGVASSRFTSVVDPHAACINWVLVFVFLD